MWKASRDYTESAPRTQTLWGSMGWACSVWHFRRDVKSLQIAVAAAKHGATQERGSIEGGRGSRMRRLKKMLRSDLPDASDEVGTERGSWREPAPAE